MCVEYSHNDSIPFIYIDKKNNRYDMSRENCMYLNKKSILIYRKYKTITPFI